MFLLAILVTFGLGLPSSEAAEFLNIFWNQSEAPQTYLFLPNDI